MTVVTFGDRPAPAMASTALHLTDEECQNSKPEACETIKKNAYMDDICGSAPSLEDADRLIHDINEVLGTGGFTIKKWIVSGSDVELEDISLSFQGPDMEDSEKVLGLIWKPNRDVFSLKVHLMFKNGNAIIPHVLTKRIVLSQVARVYDPIGFTAAFLIRAKIKIQVLWKEGLDWDSPLPEKLYEEWKTFFQEMLMLNDVTFKDA
ncbi:Uncharacterised protein r2_g4127 [Pycnogonum litorale]